MEIQLLCLQLVKSFRTTDIKLNVDSLTKTIPWMFTLAQTNHCKWLPVHIRDMQELPIKHPDAYDKLSRGFFAVHKNAKAIFSNSTRPGS